MHSHVMEASMFTDHYEILEISPNANSETIERIFRYLASRYHPDNRDTGDLLRFSEIVEAHNTLKDPVKRAQYDIQHKDHSGSRWKLAEAAHPMIRSCKRCISVCAKSRLNGSRPLTTFTPCRDPRTSTR